MEAAYMCEKAVSFEHLQKTPKNAKYYSCFCPQPFNWKAVTGSAMDL